MKHRIRYVLLSLSLWTFISCKHSDSSRVQALESSAQGGDYRINKEQPKLCTAVRGNGPLIWAHFGSMAKILENEGLIEGIAGGSSASITGFVYESILANPSVWTKCDGGACSSQNVADRASFLMKTLPFWLDIAKDSREGLAVSHILEASKTLKAFDVRSLDAQDAKALRAAFKGLHTLLQSSTIKSVLNPEFMAFISPLANEGLPTLLFRAREAKEELVKFGNFSSDSSNILFRPGILDFKAVAKLFGGIGDFYAGYDAETLKAWPSLLKTCTIFARNRTPWEINDTPCGNNFRAVLNDFLTRNGAASNVLAHRIDDRVGRVIPAIASTAVLADGEELLAAGREKYIRGENPTLTLPPDSLKFGYTSSAPVIAKLEKKMASYPDARSQRFMSLGTMFWSDVISVSPAEPGLASALPFRDGRANEWTSFGGWSDLSPVMALKAADCEKVIYVTREGEDSQFAQGVAKLLGLEPILDELYSLKTKKSSFASALNLADAVYCTKWNDYSGTSLEDIKNVFTHSYRDAVLYQGDRAGAAPGCAKVP